MEPSVKIMNSMDYLKFEKLQTAGDIGNEMISRAKITGGWLVYMKQGNLVVTQGTVSMFFVPDPEHKWNGKSLSRYGNIDSWD